VSLLQLSGQINIESGTFIFFAIGFNDSMMILHDAFTNGKAYTSAFIGRIIIQPLKYFKDLI
jgi:hypothetical protein